MGNSRRNLSPPAIDSKVMDGFSTIGRLICCLTALSRAPLHIVSRLRSPRNQTQVKLLRRVVQVVVTIVTLEIMLTTFPGIHQIAASLPASAGLAGLMLGVAMRSSLASLIAGIQLTLTQPIS